MMKHIVKQTLAFMLIAVMMTVMLSVGAAAADDTNLPDDANVSGLLGDADGDGSVTITDATCIQRVVAGLPISTEFNERLADTDEDGEITITDATFIQRWLVGLESNPNIGNPKGEEVHNTRISDDSYNTELKISEKVDSKLCSICYSKIDDIVLEPKPDAAYYLEVADKTVANLAANRTKLYAVSEGSTTADVFEELDDNTNKLGTINVSVVKAKMGEIADSSMLQYDGDEFGPQLLKANFGKSEFDAGAAIKKVLVDNKELGTKFTEDDFTVTYKSSKEKVATVNEEGIVSAVGNGESDISFSISFSDGSTYDSILSVQVTGKAIETVDGYTIDNVRDHVVGLNTPVELADGTKTPLINFDNAATTPALEAVRDAINEELEMYGSIGRGFSQKSNHSTDVYNSVRDKVLDFFTADPELYTCFYVNSTTDGLNKLASALIESEDDIVLTTRIEHHANDLSWRERCKVIYAEVDEQGRVIYDDIERLLQENKVKIVSISAASNVTGYVNDVHRVAKLAHQIRSSDCCRRRSNRSPQKVRNDG